MSLYWYACISTNTYCFEIHHIPLETNWWALSNTSSIAWIRSAVIEILADEAFTAIDGLISQLFVVTFVHPTHIRIALIWGFPAQLSLWKLVHWLWRYKLNEVCDKKGPWLQSFGHSNSLCAWATSAITNHALISKYCLRFFPNEDFKCPYGSYPIETRRHILYECMRHNEYWNPRRDALSHFIMFLNANSRAFTFIDNVFSVGPSWSWCNS